MIIRVRTNTGMLRANITESSPTAASILHALKLDRPNLTLTSPLSYDPKGERTIEDLSLTLEECQLKHGSMVYCSVEESTVTMAAANNSNSNSNNNNNSGDQLTVKKVIQKDGSIVTTYEEGAGSKNGFRAGMRSLRDIKMSWTLNEFMAMDAQYEFKISPQKESHCTGGVSLESNAVNFFQSYLRTFDFKKSRLAYLYGTFHENEDDKSCKAVVEGIYEPPQEGFLELLDDPMEEKVSWVAEKLGWKKVGWIFGHPYRPKDDSGKNSVFHSHELITMAEFQLEAADGVEPTPFVTVKVSPNEAGEVQVEAYQASMLCMEMAAEQAILVDDEEPYKCLVHETFTALVEAKPSQYVDNDYFLCNVPILQHTSEQYVTMFPWANRTFGDVQNKEAMRKQLSKSNTQGWEFIDLLSDFQMLLWLCVSEDLEESDMEKILQACKTRNLEEGYKIILASLCGLHSAY